MVEVELVDWEVLVEDEGPNDRLRAKAPKKKKNLQVLKKALRKVWRRSHLANSQRSLINLLGRSPENN